MAILAPPAAPRSPDLVVLTIFRAQRTPKDGTWAYHGGTGKAEPLTLPRAQLVEAFAAPWPRYADARGRMLELATGRARKGEAPLVYLGALAPGESRKTATAFAPALALDCDAAPLDWRECTAGAGIDAVAYATASSTPDAPRIRIVAALDRPPLRCELAAATRALAARLALPHDACTESGSQGIYPPVPGTTIVRMHGPALCVDELVVEGGGADEPAPDRELPPGELDARIAAAGVERAVDLARARLAALPVDAGCFKAACIVARDYAVPFDLAVEVIAAWDGGRHDRDHIVGKVDNALEHGNGQIGAALPSLAEHEAIAAYAVPTSARVVTDLAAAIAAEPDGTTIIVRAPQRSGKTEAAIPFVIEGATGRYVVPYQGTCSDVVARASGALADYRDASALDAAHVATTVHSCPKFSAAVDRGVVDELPAVLDQIFGAVAKDPAAALATMIDVLTLPAKSLAMSADLHTEHVDLLTALIHMRDPSRRVVVFNVTGAPMPRTIRMVTPNTLRAGLFAALDARAAGALPIVYATTSKGETEAVAIEIGRRFPALRVEVVNGGRDRVDDVNAKLAACDVLVCTHAIGIGRDIRTPIERVFMLHAGSTGPTTATQTLGRFREPQHPDLVAQRVHPRDECTDRDQIVRDEQQRCALVESHGAQYLPTDAARVERLRDPAWVLAWSYHRRWRALALAVPNLEPHIAAQPGWVIEDMRAIEVDEVDLSDARRDAVVADVAGVLSAAAPTDAYATTRADKFAMRRETIVQNFGRITKTIAKADRTGAYSSRCAALVCAQDLKLASRLDALDSKRAGRAAQGELVRSLVAAVFGVTPGIAAAFTPDAEARIAEWWTSWGAAWRLAFPGARGRGPDMGGGEQWIKGALRHYGAGFPRKRGIVTWPSPVDVVARRLSLERSIPGPDPTAEAVLPTPHTRPGPPSSLPPGVARAALGAHGSQRKAAAALGCSLRSLQRALAH